MNAATSFTGIAIPIWRLTKSIAFRLVWCLFAGEFQLQYFHKIGGTNGCIIAWRLWKPNTTNAFPSNTHGQKTSRNLCLANFLFETQHFELSGETRSLCSVLSPSVFDTAKPRSTEGSESGPPTKIKSPNLTMAACCEAERELCPGFYYYTVEFLLLSRYYSMRLLPRVVAST